LQGYSYGAISSLFAVDPKTPGRTTATSLGPSRTIPIAMTTSIRLSPRSLW